VQSRSQLRLAVGVLLFWFLLVAANGIIQFSLGVTTLQFEANPDLLRSDAAYAPTNVFGITVGALSLLSAGITLNADNRRIRTIMLLITIWLFVGAMTSISRTVAVGYVTGFIALAFASRSRAMLLITLAVSVSMLVVFIFPTAAIDRLLQVSDSSSLKRIFYLESGLRSWLAAFPFGHGWGVAYWAGDGNSLIRSSSYPWYHNDYLNLAVQTGVVGLLIYLAFWYTVMHAGFKAIREPANAETDGILAGSFAALVFLLTAALFEHVLWRPDIAGLVGWMLGIMLASIALQHQLDDTVVGSSATDNTADVQPMPTGL
jgi:O-antigen ligase